MAPEKHKNMEVYRSSDVQVDTAIKEYHKQRQVVKWQAYQRGRKLHLKREDE